MPALRLQKLYQQKLHILQNKTIRFVLDCHSRSHVGIADFKMLNWILFRSVPNKLTFVKYRVWYMSRRLSILKWNFPWLVNVIPSLPDIVCSPLSYHIRNHLGPNHLSFRPPKCGMLFQHTLNQLQMVLPLSVG